MEMCYDGALVLPSSCAVMSEEEMTYVEGGKFGQIAVSPRYLSKQLCLNVAHSYAGKKLSDGKSYGASRLAAEIYAHTLLFYTGMMASVQLFALELVTGFSSSKINKIVKYILNHSNPIDLGGDGTARVAVYTALWKL